MARGLVRGEELHDVGRPRPLFETVKERAVGRLTHLYDTHGHGVAVRLGREVEGLYAGLADEFRLEADVRSRQETADSDFHLEAASVGGRRLAPDDEVVLRAAHVEEVTWGLRDIAGDLGMDGKPVEPGAWADFTGRAEQWSAALRQALPARLAAAADLIRQFDDLATARGLGRDHAGHEVLRKDFLGDVATAAKTAREPEQAARAGGGYRLLMDRWAGRLDAEAAGVRLVASVDRVDDLLHRGGGLAEAFAKAGREPVAWGDVSGEVREALKEDLTAEGDRLIGDRSPAQLSRADWDALTTARTGVLERLLEQLPARYDFQAGLRGVLAEMDERVAAAAGSTGPGDRAAAVVRVRDDARSAMTAAYRERVGMPDQGLWTADELGRRETAFRSASFEPYARGLGARLEFESDLTGVLDTAAETFHRHTSRPDPVTGRAVRTHDLTESARDTIADRYRGEVAETFHTVFGPPRDVIAWADRERQDGDTFAATRQGLWDDLQAKTKRQQATQAAQTAETRQASVTGEAKSAAEMMRERRAKFLELLEAGRTRVLHEVQERGGTAHPDTPPAPRKSVTTHRRIMQLKDLGKDDASPSGSSAGTATGGHWRTGGLQQRGPSRGSQTVAQQPGRGPSTDPGRSTQAAGDAATGPGNGAPGAFRGMGDRLGTKEDGGHTSPGTATHSAAPRRAGPSLFSSPGAARDRAERTAERRATAARNDASRAAQDRARAGLAAQVRAAEAAARSARTAVNDALADAEKPGRPEGSVADMSGHAAAEVKQGPGDAGTGPGETAPEPVPGKGWRAGNREDGTQTAPRAVAGGTGSQGLVGAGESASAAPGRRAERRMRMVGLGSRPMGPDTQALSARRPPAEPGKASPPVRPQPPVLRLRPELTLKEVIDELRQFVADLHERRVQDAEAAVRASADALARVEGAGPGLEAARRQAAADQAAARAARADAAVSAREQCRRAQQDAWEAAQASPALAEERRFVGARYVRPEELSRRGRVSPWMPQVDSGGHEVVVLDGPYRVRDNTMLVEGRWLNAQQVAEHVRLNRTSHGLPLLVVLLAGRTGRDRLWAGMPSFGGQIHKALNGARVISTAAEEMVQSSATDFTAGTGIRDGHNAIKLRLQPGTGLVLHEEGHEHGIPLGHDLAHALSRFGIRLKAGPQPFAEPLVRTFGPESHTPALVPYGTAPSYATGSGPVDGDTHDDSIDAIAPAGPSPAHELLDPENSRWDKDLLTHVNRSWRRHPKWDGDQVDLKKASEHYHALLQENTLFRPTAAVRTPLHEQAQAIVNMLAGAETAHAWGRVRGGASGATGTSEPADLSDEEFSDNERSSSDEEPDEVDPRLRSQPTDTVSPDDIPVFTKVGTGVVNPGGIDPVFASGLVGFADQIANIDRNSPDADGIYIQVTGLIQNHGADARHNVLWSAGIVREFIAEQLEDVSDQLNITIRAGARECGSTPDRSGQTAGDSDVSVEIALSFTSRSTHTPVRGPWPSPTYFYTMDGWSSAVRRTFAGVIGDSLLSFGPAFASHLAGLESTVRTTAADDPRAAGIIHIQVTGFFRNDGEREGVQSTVENLQEVIDAELHGAAREGFGIVTHTSTRSAVGSTPAPSGQTAGDPRFYVEVTLGLSPHTEAIEWLANLSRESGREADDLVRTLVHGPHEVNARHRAELYSLMDHVMRYAQPGLRTAGLPVVDVLNILGAHHLESIGFLSAKTLELDADDRPIARKWARGHYSELDTATYHVLRVSDDVPQWDIPIDDGDSESDSDWGFEDETADSTVENLHISDTHHDSDTDASVFDELFDDGDPDEVIHNPASAPWGPRRVFVLPTQDISDEEVLVSDPGGVLHWIPRGHITELILLDPVMAGLGSNVHLLMPTMRTSPTTNAEPVGEWHQTIANRTGRWTWEHTGSTTTVRHPITGTTHIAVHKNRGTRPGVWLPHQPPSEKPARSAPPATHPVLVFNRPVPRFDGGVLFLTDRHWTHVDENNLTPHDVSADGDCFYHALIDLALPHLRTIAGADKATTTTTTLIAKLRNMIADHLIARADFYRDFLDHFPYFGDVTRAAADIRQAGSYMNDASDLAPVIAATLFSLRLTIVQPDGTTITNGPENGLPLTLFRYTTGGAHFLSGRPSNPRQATPNSQNTTDHRTEPEPTPPQREEQAPPTAAQPSLSDQVTAALTGLDDLPPTSPAQHNTHSTPLAPNPENPPAPRQGAITHDLDRRRPPQLDRDLPAPPGTSEPVRFTDNRKLPVFMGGVGALLKDLPESVLRRSYTFGNADTALRGADLVVDELESRLTSPSVRPGTPGGRTGLLSKVRRGLTTDPEGFFGDGQEFSYRNATGKVRVLKVVARPYPNWERFTFGYANPTKIDTMARNVTTTGRTAVNSTSRSFSPAVVLGPLRAFASPWGRLFGRKTWRKRLQFSMLNQVTTQGETRTTDGAHAHLSDVYYEFSVTDGKRDPIVQVGRPAPANSTAMRPHVFGFAVRHGLFTRLPDSTTQDTDEGADLRKDFPQEIKLDKKTNYRFFTTDAFGPVSHIRDWAAEQIKATPGGAAYTALDSYFSSENFKQTSRKMAAGRTITPPLFAYQNLKPLGTFSVRVESTEAVLIDATTAAELRDISQSTVRNVREKENESSTMVGGTAGPSFQLFDLGFGKLDLRLLLGLTARYNHGRGRAVQSGGTSAIRTAAQAKGSPTGLYLVRKTVHVTAPPTAKAPHPKAGAATSPTTDLPPPKSKATPDKLRKNPPEKWSAPPSTESFETWAVERLTLAEARRLAFDDTVAKSPEPVPPRYLTVDDPATLGMHRVEEFTFADKTYVKDVAADGADQTFLDHFGDLVLREVAKVYPGLVAPLDQLNPSDPRWRGESHFQIVQTNTHEVLNTFNHHAMAGNLTTMMAVGFPIELVESGRFTRAKRHLWVKARLTDRQFEGTQKELRLRYSAPGSEVLFARQKGRRGVDGGVEFSVSPRDTDRDEINSPEQAGTVSFGVRGGYGKDMENGFGPAATHEAMSIGAKGSHLYSYKLSLTVDHGGFVRVRGFLRGVSLNILGTRQFVFTKEDSPLLSKGPEEGRVLISIPVDHSPPRGRDLGTATDRRPDPPPVVTEKLTAAQALDLALATPEALDEAALRPPTELQNHPYLTVAVVSPPDLTKAAQEALDEASGDAWQLKYQGAPAHDAALRTFDPRELTANVDQTSSPIGKRARVESKGAYLDRTATLAHRTAIPPESLEAITDAVQVETETTVGGAAQAVGRVAKSTRLFFGGQFVYLHSHSTGSGTTGNYSATLSPYASRNTRTVTVSRQAVAEINRKDTGHQVLVQGDKVHEIAVASTSVGRRALDRKVPRYLAGAAGRRVTVPGGWVGHLPEKSAHRLGLIDSKHGDVLLYTEQSWSPQPWLSLASFGSFPVNSLDTAPVLADFDRKLRPLGLNADDRATIHQMVGHRIVRALNKEMAANGSTVPVRVGDWGLESVNLWLTDRPARVAVQLVRYAAGPEGDGSGFGGLGHSVELEEHRHAVESVQEGRSKLSGKSIGWATMESAHTDNEVARAAGPGYAELGSSQKTVTANRLDGSVQITTTTTTQAHGEYATRYKMILTAEIGEGPPDDRGNLAERTWRTGTGTSKRTITSENDVGLLIEHFPLSLMRPDPRPADVENGPADPLGPPELSAPGPARHTAVPPTIGPGGWRDTPRPRGGEVKPFELPDDGYSVRGIIGIQHVQDANTVAVADAYSTSFPVFDQVDEKLLMEARDTALTRGAEGSGQVLEYGTNNIALTAFYRQTLTAEGYSVPGLSEAALLGGSYADFRIHSRPNFGGAQLLTVADGLKHEAPRRSLKSDGMSVDRSGGEESGLGGGPTLASEPTGTGVSQVGSGDSSADAEGLTSAGEGLASVNVKPNAARSFLFAVPTTWLSVAAVHHQMKDSAAGTFTRDTFGYPSKGQRALETDTLVLAWVREDVARDLGLINNTNFPKHLAEAWDAVTKADAAWTAADKRYMSALRAASATDRAAAEAEATTQQPTAPDGDGAARPDTARERDGLGKQLADLGAHAKAAAGELHRVRLETDRLTRWHQLAATEEGRRLLGNTPQPERVVFRPQPAPEPKKDLPKAVEVPAANAPAAERAPDTAPDTAAGTAAGTAAPGTRPAYATPPWQSDGGQGGRRFDAMADHLTLTETDSDGTSHVYDLAAPTGHGNGFYAAVRLAEGEHRDAAHLADLVSVGSALRDDMPLDPQAVFRPAEVRHWLTGTAAERAEALRDLELGGGRIPDAVAAGLTPSARRELTKWNLRAARRWDRATARAASALTADVLKAGLTVVSENGSFEYFAGSIYGYGEPEKQLTVYERGGQYVAAVPRVEGTGNPRTDRRLAPIPELTRSGAPAEPSAPPGADPADSSEVPSGPGPSEPSDKARRQLPTTQQLSTPNLGATPRTVEQGHASERVSQPQAGPPPATGAPEEQRTRPRSAPDPATPSNGRPLTVSLDADPRHSETLTAD